MTIAEALTWIELNQEKWRDRADELHERGWDAEAEIYEICAEDLGRTVQLITVLHRDAQSAGEEVRRVD